MIIGGFGAILALIVVGVILIGLLVIAFFNWRMALAGLVILLVWLFYPVAKAHLVFAWEVARSDYDAVRYIDDRWTSDSLSMAGYGVNLPDDGSLVRCNTGWWDDPSQCRWFEIPTNLSATPITIRVYGLGKVHSERLEILDAPDLCPTQSTDIGLLYIAPDVCDASDYFHTYITMADAETGAVFRTPRLKDSSEMALLSVRQGPYLVAVTANGVAITEWPAVLETITKTLNDHFTVLPAP